MNWPLVIPKVTGFIIIIFLVPTIKDKNILAPDVFNYADSKSESWYRAKKFEKYLWTTKCPPLLFVIKNRVFFIGAFIQ